VRFVRLHGAPEGRAATLLRRWVWRSAVAGTRARGVSVADIRGQIATLDAVEPVGAATALLRQVQPFPDFTAELDKIHFNHAMAKLNVLGLLSVEPRDPISGEAIDVTRLLDQGSPLRPIVASDHLVQSGTIANRVVLASRDGRPIHQALVSASAEVAASHLIDEQSRQRLANGEWESFLELRTEACRSTITGHINRMAEWGARDGRSVSDLLRSAA
jgi:hypothetical protein